MIKVVTIFLKEKKKKKVVTIFVLVLTTRHTCEFAQVSFYFYAWVQKDEGKKI